MRKYLPWIALATGAYIAFIISAFPADSALRMFAPEEFRTTNARGTVWSGQADLASIPGLALRNVGWRINGLPLLLLKTSGNVSADLAPGFVNTDFSLSKSRVTLTDLQLSTALSAFVDLLPISGTNGGISATLEEISFADNWPVSVVGELRVSDLMVEPIFPRGGSLIPLGNLAITFTTPESGRVVGQFRDLGGPLEVSGSLELSGNRRYQIEALVKPRADAPDTLIQGLQMMTADPDSEGRHLFEQSGSL